MSARTELVTRLASLVGTAMEIEELGNGWPSLARLNIDGSIVPLALFVSPIGSSHRDRDAVERRFQNPTNISLQGVPGRESVLLGVWDTDQLMQVDHPVIAVAEAHRRDDGRTTRWSVFLLLAALVEALDTGWATNVSDSGETIYYVHPIMLPVAITATMTRAEPQEKSIYGAISTLGLMDRSSNSDELPNSERVRRTVTALVRDSKFSGRVLDAYGRRCAMCGLGLGLVQGAHIYPASAPGSKDETSNGIALCANHHLAFDRHLIAVRPATLELLFHPSVLERAEQDSAAALFVHNTRDVLRSTTGPNAPDSESFVKRYGHFKVEYAWIARYWG